MNAPKKITTTNSVAVSYSLLLGLMCALSNQTSAQSLHSRKSPKEVLQAYREMDSAGERLTAAGWYQASHFFIKPVQPPKQYVLAVTESERVTDPDPWFKGGTDKVEIAVACSQLGQIDSLGRFMFTVTPSLIDSLGNLVKWPVRPKSYGPAPVFRLYDLVFTDTYWEFTPGNGSLREAKGPPEWRIEAFEFEPYVTIEAAIRYLTRLQNESSSAVIRRNAEKSIAALRHLPHWSRCNAC